MIIAKKQKLKRVYLPFPDLGRRESGKQFMIYGPCVKDNICTILEGGWTTTDDRLQTTEPFNII